MGRATNRLVAGLNAFVFLSSVAVLGAGIWLASKTSSDCLKFLEYPLIILAVSLLATSLLAFLGLFLHSPCLLRLYLLLLFLLVLSLASFTAFAFAVTAKGKGRQAPGTAFLEFRFSDYSGWLKERVSDGGHWRKIESCLMGSRICGKMGRFVVVRGPPASVEPEPPELFFRRDLSPLESGCCKPPTSCGFTYLNETVWIGTSTTIAEDDCRKWSNDQGRLCYECDSCRASVLAMVKKRWRKAATVTAVIIVVLLILFSTACLLLWNSLSFSRRESSGEARMIKTGPGRFRI